MAYYVDRIERGVRVARSIDFPARDAADRAMRAMRLQYHGSTFVVTEVWRS